MIAGIPIIISLASFWLAYRAYRNSRHADEVSSQYHALSAMSEWRGSIRKVEWEYMFVSREIGTMLKAYKDHPELLMWQDKIKKLDRLLRRCACGRRQLKAVVRYCGCKSFNG